LKNINIKCQAVDNLKSEAMLLKMHLGGDLAWLRGGSREVTAEQDFPT